MASDSEFLELKRRLAQLEQKVAGVKEYGEYAHRMNRNDIKVLREMVLGVSPREKRLTTPVRLGGPVRLR